MQDTQSEQVSLAKALKPLKKAIRNDKLFIAANAQNAEAISRWFDKFCPDGDIGHKVFEKTLRRVTGINIKYQHER